MNDLLACTHLFINLQAMEPLLKDGYHINIERYYNKRLQHAVIHFHILSDDCFIGSLINPSDTVRLMHGKISPEALANEIWRRIPAYAKRPSS